MPQKPGDRQDSLSASFEPGNTDFVSNRCAVQKDEADKPQYYFNHWRLIRITGRGGVRAFRLTVSVTNSKFPLRKRLTQLQLVNLSITEQTANLIKLTGIRPDKKMLLPCAYDVNLLVQANGIQQVILHNRDTNIRVTYDKVPSAKVLEAIDIPIDKHVRSFERADFPGAGELIRRYDAVVAALEAGSNPVHAKAAYYLHYGKLKFAESRYEEAREAIFQCSMLLRFTSYQGIHEIVYLFAKIEQAQGKPESAKKFFQLALQQYRDIPGLVSREQIEYALQELL